MKRTESAFGVREKDSMNENLGLKRKNGWCWGKKVGEVCPAR
jgi:hypothetical protein